MAKKSNSFLKRKKSFSGSQILLFVIAFAAVGTVAIWQSLAAPHNGGGGGTGTISMVMAQDVNSDGLPNYGDKVTFKVSTTATAYPAVELDCFQGSTLVFQSWRSFVDKDPFPLSGTTQWQGGAADCTAYLQNWDSYSKNRKFINISSTTFHVNS